jgi:hypothetical protein
MVYRTPSAKDAKRNIALGLPTPKGKPGSLNFGKIKKIFASANEPGNLEALAQAKELVALVQKTPAQERTHVMKYAINEWRVPTWASKKRSDSIAMGLFTGAEVTAAERQVNKAVTAQAVAIASLAIAEPSRDGTADEYLRWYASTQSAERWGLTHTSLAIADFRAIETCKRLAPLPSEKGKEGPGLRSAWTRNYISLIAIPNYYRDLCHAHRWVISPTRSFNWFKGSTANLSQTEVAQHLAANGISLADVQSYQVYARRWISDASKAGKLGNPHAVISRTWFILNNVGAPMFPIEDISTGMIVSESHNQNDHEEEPKHIALLESIVEPAALSAVGASSFQEAAALELNRTEVVSGSESTGQPDRSPSPSEQDELSDEEGTTMEF